MENESLVTEPTEELPDEQLSPAHSTEGGEPKEEPKESQPQPDIETRFQELERKFAERDAKLLAELERTTKRLKDSNDSVVKRIHERLKPIQEDYQELIQAGTMTAEDASRRIADKRLRFEAEELGRTSQTQEDRDTTKAPKGMRRAIDTIVAETHFLTSDPEYRKLQEILDGRWIDENGEPTDDPVTAVEGVRMKAGELVKQKEARISAAKQRKQQEVAEKIPTMTTLGGQAVPESATAEELTVKISNGLKNLPRDPSARKKAKEQIDRWEEQLAKVTSH